MGRLPTVAEYLAVPGVSVHARERSAGPISPYLKQYGSLAPWLLVEHVPDTSVVARHLVLRADRRHGPISFVGTLENRMREPLVIVLRALRTGVTDLDTPATPAFLDELPQPTALRVVVSVNCPFCPVVAQVALRFATCSTKVSVEVVRADVPGAPQVRSVPTILDDKGQVASGPVQELALAELLLSRQGVNL